MAKPTRISLDELEGMERRMRRLLESPIATTTVSHNTSRIVNRNMGGVPSVS